MKNIAKRIIALMTVLALILSMTCFIGCGESGEVHTAGTDEGQAVDRNGNPEEGDQTPAAPEKSAEEIAASLDTISDTVNQTVFYDTPYIPAGADANMQLVNKVCGVSKDYTPANLQLTKYRATDRAEANQYMVDYAANAMDSMIEAAMAEGHTILVTTAYRSYNFQSVLYNNYVAKDGQAAADKYSARPGTSEHHTGLAADVTSPSVNYQLTKKYGETAEGQWLAAHAHEYGFILRYTVDGESITGYMYEPWHFRYVGVEAATEIHEKGITLEEYIAEKY